MTKTTLAFVALIALALPAYGKTYKSIYPVPCGDVWSSVKVILNDAEHYAIVDKDDAKMTASYDVKHAAHVTITGAILQRTNRVTLVPKGAGCEMQVVSNFSGWEHTDRRDFKTRVDESLAKLKTETPAEPATAPAQPAKAETPAN